MDQALTHFTELSMVFLAVVALVLKRDAVVTAAKRAVIRLVLAREHYLWDAFDRSFEGEAERVRQSRQNTWQRERLPDFSWPLTPSLGGGRG